MSAKAPVQKSVKTVLFVALSLLAALFVGSIAWKGLTSFAVYRSELVQQDFDQGANRFIKGLFEVLMERLATNNGLQAADPAPPAVISEIEKRRSAVKANFDAGLAALSQRDFPNKTALMQELQVALDKANDLRKRADAALKQGRDQRDETLRKTFIPVVTDSVNAALKVWFSALYTTAKSDPQLAMLASIKEIGWQMRDWAGKERSHIASSIAAGAALTPEMIAANATYRARVDMLWEQLQHLTNDPATHPAIKNAMRAAEDQYFKGFRDRADELRKIGASGAKYPMTAPQYVDEIDAAARSVARSDAGSGRRQRSPYCGRDRPRFVGVDDCGGAACRRYRHCSRFDDGGCLARLSPSDPAFARRAAACRERHRCGDTADATQR